MSRDSVDLSAAERELLEELCHGKRDREIAAELGVYRESVTRRVLRVMDKLGASTRCEAIAMYCRSKPPV